MYLSHLLIDVGDNPDRPRPGRLWLRNIYHVHQRLCMAFPSDERKNTDPDFLSPYNPDDFKQVHIERDENSGFLFRIDPHPSGNVSILVLSAKEPDWDYAFHNAGYLLAGPPSTLEPLKINIESGAQFRFKLKANPMRKLSKNSKFPDGTPVTVKYTQEEIDKGIRVPQPFNKLEDWLMEQGGKNGFFVDSLLNKTCGYAHFCKNDHKAKLFSVDFEGVLEVTDDCKFKKALLSGIGPAKAFGFGLLTISPL